MPIYRTFYGPVCGLLANSQSYIHSGQNIAKIFTCVRYLTGLEKLPGAVFWNVGRRSNEAYIWRSYSLTIWRVLRKSYIRIYRYMPWYHSKPHIWRYFLVFVVISQSWHILIRPTRPNYPYYRYLTIWRVS